MTQGRALRRWRAVTVGRMRNLMKSYRLMKSSIGQESSSDEISSFIGDEMDPLSRDT